MARLSATLLSLGIVLGAPPGSAAGQSDTATRDARTCCDLTVGSQAVSAIVWRGMEFTRSPSLQPWIEVGWGAATLETAGSWAMDGSWAEQDVTATVAAASRAGTTALLVSAHFYPAEKGLQTPVTEAGLGYTTEGALPVRALVTANVAHDRDHAAQAELGIGHEWGRLGAELFGGVALNRSAYYDARAGDVLQLGAEVTHRLTGAGGVEGSLGAGAVYSPAHARSWLIVRAAIALPLRAETERPPLAGAPPPRS